jgi:hypothetical protein
VDIREVHVDYVDHVERLRCWTRGRFYDTINIDKSVVDNYFWGHNEGPGRLRGSHGQRPSSGLFPAYFLSGETTCVRGHARNTWVKWSLGKGPLQPSPRPIPRQSSVC